VLCVSQTRLGKSRTVLQQHVDFFDTDGDGVISCLDTYKGGAPLFGLFSMTTTPLAEAFNG
jgi:hypothetical protein